MLLRTGWHQLMQSPVMVATSLGGLDYVKREEEARCNKLTRQLGLRR